jgi:DNA-binding transcriptional LysR family regulator
VDARQLGYFLAIVDHGGFGRAADQLLIAQPSLSQAMAGLERELGVKLFVRAGRGVRLTDAGEQLVGPARRVLRDLDDAAHVVRSAKALRRGRVTLVTMPSPGIEPLTTIMTDFASVWPAMTVDVAGVFTPEEVVETVLSGQAEVGVLGASAQPHTADLAVRWIEDQPLVLISPPGAPLPKGDVVDRAGLSGLRLIVSQRGSLMRQLVDDVLASGTDVQVVAEVAHRTSILPLVVAGMGHAVMPSSWNSIARAVGAEVRRIEPGSVLRVAAVWREASLTPGASAFLEVLDRHVTTSPVPD